MSLPLSREDVLFRQRLWRQAGLYLGKLDGLYGAKSAAASEEWDRLYRACRDRYGELDGRSEDCLRSVLPAMQDKGRQLMALLKLDAVRAKILSGTRTYAQQSALYAQGRSKAGRIVTRARAGQSMHNFGVAIDLGVFSQEGAYLGESPLYATAGELAEQIEGLEWGGNWKGFRDMPHHQLRTGLSVREMRSRFEAGESFAAAAPPRRSTRDS